MKIVITFGSACGPPGAKASQNASRRDDIAVCQNVKNTLMVRRGVRADFICFRAPGRAEIFFYAAKRGPIINSGPHALIPLVSSLALVFIKALA